MSMVEQSPAVQPSEMEEIQWRDLSELGSQLDDARAHWAQISSKRQNRMLERRIHGYNEAKRRYDRLVVEYGRQLLAQDLFLAEDDSQRRQLTVAYLIDQQNTLREMTDQNVASKLSRKIGNAAGKWLTTGSKKVQLAKGIAVGAAAGLAGGIVGVGVAVPLAVKFAKGYVTSEVRGLGQTELSADDLLVDTQGLHFDELLERAQAVSSDRFSEDGKDQQAQRRKAAKRGLGVVATGLVLGGAIGLAVDGMHLPSAGAAPTNDNSVNPGIYDGSENPGLANQPSVNPGLYDPGSVSEVSPGIFDAGSDADVNPGLAGDDDAVNPGLAISEADAVSPGLADTDSSVNPGLIGHDDAVNPGLAAPEDGAVNPGLAEVQPGAGDDSILGTGDADQRGTFTVEYGNGYTHELIDAAAAHGVDMTAEQALAAHELIVDQLGTADYIDLTDHNGPDTYPMGDSSYETGISSPGEATWSPESIDLVNDAIDNGEIDNSYEASADSGDAVHPGINQSQAEAPADQAEMRETRIIERSELGGLEQAAEDNADWSDLKADMNQMESYLRDGNLDAVNSLNDYQNTLSYIARDGGGIEYPNSDVKIMAWDKVAERWMINPVPEGSFVPQRVIDLIGDYQQSLYRLAA